MEIHKNYQELQVLKAKWYNCVSDIYMKCEYHFNYVYIFAEKEEKRREFNPSQEIINDIFKDCKKFNEIKIQNEIKACKKRSSINSRPKSLQSNHEYPFLLELHRPMMHYHNLPLPICPKTTSHQLITERKILPANHNFPILKNQHFELLNKTVHQSFSAVSQKHNRNPSSYKFDSNNVLAINSKIKITKKKQKRKNYIPNRYTRHYSIAENNNLDDEKD